LSVVIVAEDAGVAGVAHVVDVVEEGCLLTNPRLQSDWIYK
jgi:hypothetical protein